MECFRESVKDIERVGFLEGSVCLRETAFAFTLSGLLGVK